MGKELVSKTYKDRLEEQTYLWAEGVSIHNQVEDECCPDFSCCRPGLLASEEDRKVFKVAHDSGRRDVVDSMLTKFLKAFLKEEVKTNAI